MCTPCSPASPSSASKDRSGKIGSCSTSQKKPSSTAPTSKYKPVTHIIFEVDGVLINSVPTYMEILNKVTSDYNRGLIPLELKRDLLGRGENDAFNLVILKTGLPIRFPAMKTLVNEEEQNRYPKCKMIPGAERLICHLAKRGIPMGIASSSLKENINLKMTSCKGVYDNIQVVVGGSDDEEVTKCKPDPAVFTVCASRFPDNPEPASCLVIDSSLHGIHAACCAGMQVVAVLDPMIDPKCAKDATLIVQTLAEFQPELFGIDPIPK